MSANEEGKVADDVVNEDDAEEVSIFEKLTSIIHWAQDRHRISVAIHVEGPATDLPQQERFLEELTEASQRETIRVNSDESRMSRAT